MKTAVDFLELLKQQGVLDIIDGKVAAPTRSDGDPDVNGDDRDDLSTFSNFVPEENPSGGKPKDVPLKINYIINDLFKRTENWPRRVGSSLFISDPQHGIAWFAKQCELFGWIHHTVGAAGVDWKRGTDFVTKEELFAELSRTAFAYRHVDQFPHFPPVCDVFYSHREIGPGDGTALNDLVARFSPATDLDGDLIRALVVTLFWGGPSGARPAFVITSDDGRGAGKSKFASLVARIVGGAFDVSLGEQIDNLKKRLLTVEAIAKRVALIDNVKTQKLSWAELEGLVTAPEISGHRLFKGERSRPNLLTWMLTLNGPALSRDMSQRSVVIKLKKAIYSPSWEEDAMAFIDENRERIIADVAAFYASDAVELTQCSRWAAWERAIVARLPEPADVQTVIAERQAALDTDSEEAGEIEEYFATQLEALGYDSDHNCVHIPSNVARQWYGAATGDRYITTTAMSRAVNQGAKEGTLKRLRKNPSNSHGRGLLWIVGPHTFTSYDLIERKQQTETEAKEKELRMANKIANEPTYP